MHSSYTLVVASTNMDASLQGWVAFVLFASPKVHVCCSSPICSSVSRAHSFSALKLLFLYYPFIKGLSFQPQTTQMSSSQDICSSLVLASRDTSDSIRQHCCLCFLFISRELPLLGHVYLFWHLLPLFLQEQVCSSTFSCSRGMNPWQTISGGLISPFI